MGSLMAMEESAETTRRNRKEPGSAHPERDSEREESCKEKENTSRKELSSAHPRSSEGVSGTPGRVSKSTHPREVHGTTGRVSKSTHPKSWRLTRDGLGKESKSTHPRGSDT